MSKGDKKKLQCSFNVSNPDKGRIKSSCMGFAGGILSFQKRSIISIAVNFNTLTRDGDDLGLYLINNKASFHKSCKTYFTNYILLFELVYYLCTAVC